MNHCKQLKEILIASGRAGIDRNPELAAHLHGCAECQRLLRAWAQIPQLLEELPPHEPEKALLRAVNGAVSASRPGSKQTGSKQTGSKPPGSKQWAPRRWLAPSLASAAVLLAAIGISHQLLMHESPRIAIPSDRQLSTGKTLAGRDTDALSKTLHDERGQAITNEAAPSRAPVAGAPLEESAQFRSGDGLSLRAQKKAAEQGDKKPLAGERRKSTMQAPEPQPPRSESPAASREAMVRQALPATEFEADRGNGPAVKAAADREMNDEVETSEIEASKIEAFARADLGKKEGREEPAPPTNASGQVTVGGGAGAYAESRGKVAAASGFDFLAYYAQTDGLQFQPAKGYWANTYVPGDPEIRLLSARLAQWDRSWLPGDGALERHVAPLSQPFDAPDDNALSLSVMADVNAVPTTHAATRLRVQVGIQGIEHRRGQRPAMNVGVVVDLPADAADHVRIAARSLLDALLESKQAGDRFSVVVTGETSETPGLVVPADEFRFGSLRLAEDIVMGRPSAVQLPDGTEMQMESLDLYRALQRAGEMVQQTDDPGRPLGSSSVLLISARKIDDIEPVSALVHENAKRGITLSVFPLGTRAQDSQAEALVLAGLGNRRFLEAPAQARQLIEEELHAASRAVARAARLSIRLAPGVQLIGVVGSEPLDAQRSQRVREIEDSVDRRLAANLGIQADRGNDEDGIQIVIPGIFSGDSVAVLLDVVTDRPGAIADVSLRYKDLVFLRNGNLQGHLELPAGEPDRGPAELSVLKNLLSYHFALAAKQAAEALGRGQAGEAAAILRGMSRTIEKARQDLPAWADDPDLIRDRQVLERYIAALTSPQAGAHRDFLLDSLQFTAWATTHRPLEEWK